MPQVDKATFLPVVFWIFVLYVDGFLFLNSTYLYTFVSAMKLNFRCTSQKLALTVAARRTFFMRLLLLEPLYKILVNFSTALLKRTTATPLGIYAGHLLLMGTPFWGLQPVDGGAGLSTPALRAYYERLCACVEQVYAYKQAYEACTDLAELERIQDTYSGPTIELFKQVNFGALHQARLRGVDPMLHYTAERHKVLSDLVELRGADAIPVFDSVYNAIDLTLQYHEGVLPYNKVVFSLAQEAGFLTYSLCTDTTTAFGGYVTVLLGALLLACFFWVASAHSRYGTPGDGLPNLTDRPFYLWPFASWGLLLTSVAVLIVVVLEYPWKCCVNRPTGTLLRTSHRQRKRKN